MHSAVTDRSKKVTKLLLLVGAIAVMIGTISASGVADFSTSSTTQSIVGSVVKSDDSFTINSAGISIATAEDAGTAAGTSAKELTNPIPTLRANAVSTGNFVYRVTLTEDHPLNSGIWAVQVFEEGTQIGNTLTIKQTTTLGGNTEGATILVDLGNSMLSTTTLELKITKTE